MAKLSGFFVVLIVATSLHLSQPLLLAAASDTASSNMVSMEKAYTHFFLTFARDSNPSLWRSVEEQEAILADRRSSFSRHIGLNDEQASVVIDEAVVFLDAVDALRSEARRVAGPATEGSRMTEQQARELLPFVSNKDAVLGDCVQNMYSRLDEQGDDIVYNYVLYTVRPNVGTKGGAK